jgi:hypothetical protein
VEAARALAARGLDWAALLAGARVARIGAFLAHLVEAAGLDPGDQAGPLRSEAERVAAQAGLTVHVAVRAQAALAAAGLDSLALKGLAFQAHDPAHLQRRHFDDVDLLVPPEALGAAAAALLAAGFEADGPLPDYSGRALGDATGSPVLHRTLNFLGPGGTLVELHPVLFDEPGGETTLAALLSRAVEVPVGRGRVRVPGLEDALGMLCRHVVVHHDAEALYLPRHVADVAALLAAGADPAVAGLRMDVAGRRSVAWSLALLEAARLGRGRAGRLFTPVLAPLDALRVRLGLYGGAARAEGLRVLFPSRRYMARLYRLPESSPRLLLMYAWRPLRGAVRLLLGR